MLWNVKKKTVITSVILTRNSKLTAVLEMKHLRRASLSLKHSLIVIGGKG